MKYQELRDHITGYHLMKHDLEAFLIQNAYLESLLKAFVDFNFSRETDGKMPDNKLLRAVKKDIEKYSLSALIDLLERADLLSEEQKKLLSDYKQKKNRILYDLLGQATPDFFKEELISAYEIGKKIADGREFKQMEEMLDDMERKILSRKNDGGVAISG